MYFSFVLGLVSSSLCFPLSVKEGGFRYHCWSSARRAKDRHNAYIICALREKAPVLPPLLLPITPHDKQQRQSDNPCHSSSSTSLVTFPIYRLKWSQQHPLPNHLPFDAAVIIVVSEWENEFLI